MRSISLNWIKFGHNVSIFYIRFFWLHGHVSVLHLILCIHKSSRHASLLDTSDILLFSRLLLGWHLLLSFLFVNDCKRFRFLNVLRSRIEATVLQRLLHRWCGGKIKGGDLLLPGVLALRISAFLRVTGKCLYIDRLVKTVVFLLTRTI